MKATKGSEAKRPGFPEHEVKSRPANTDFRMHAKMRLGPVSLRVKNLDAELSFYETNFRLRETRRYRHRGLESVELSFVNGTPSEEPLLILQHDPNASMGSPRSAGLYHFALLVPDRKSLASTYLALGNSGSVDLQGFADHFVSEALYLADPEDNGIEIYRDRPREEWYDSRGQLKMGTSRLDFNSLLRELTPEETKSPVAFPLGAKIGHDHLKVTNLERSVKFYHEQLGLDITLDASSFGAAFLSVGGYHHHIGLNTWQSLGGSARKIGEAGLEKFAMIVPDASFVETLASRMRFSLRSGENRRELLIRDPDGNQIRIKSE